jgi:hypothetical protein
MRKPDQITVDRLLLLHLLQTAEPFGLLNDVKLQQLTFLCELQMFAKGLKGFHFEFFRYAYGAFSKDLDNDLMSMRRKERVENFSVSRGAEDIIELFLEESEKTKSETNVQVLEILDAVVTNYAPQDTDKLSKSVEAVEISSPAEPEFKLAIETVSFHTILLVPSRIETQSEFTLPTSVLARLNAALGY